MSVLDLEYDSADSIPEGYGGLFTERDGKMVLTEISGMKTQTDINNLQEALRKERNDHKAVRDSYAPWKDMDYNAIQEQLDRIPSLEAAANGKTSELDEAARLQISAPLQRQIDGIAKERDEYKTEADGLRSTLNRRDMTDAVRAVATEMNVLSTAIPDVEMVAERYLERTEDGGWMVKADINGITPGIDIKGFLKEMQRTRPHWWPPSEGGGAGGGGGGGGTDPAKNPWTSKGWNLTRQGEVIRSEGGEVAARLAKEAGSFVGATRPPEK